MCGIAGFIDRSGSAGGSELLQARVTAMTDAIVYRGPDDSGVWTDTATGVALGHRRLSIIDLSAEGHQPMISHGGRSVIVFNGEIYNFLEIRKDLEGRGSRFRGHSDTEVMLEAFEEWGIDASVRRFNGMFAFAVWNQTDRTLTLCRDRIGKKPLYYGWVGNTLLFGSELKALRAHPRFNAEIDQRAIALLLRHGYIPAPWSIYKGIYKLPAASHLTIREADRGGNGTPVPYWSARTAAEDGLRNRIEHFDDALAELETLARDAVGLRMIADVPLGAFLSGGIDSSLVVSLMQAQSTKAVKTFCIGFAEQSHNEADHARAVARHLGTDHTEITLTPSEALGIVPRLPHMFDEPFADSSQIPTFLVSEMARRHVTVSLSGDGGDELFAGYSAYTSCASFYSKYEWLRGPLRPLAANLMRGVPQSVWNRILPGNGVMTAGARLHRLGSTLLQPTEETAYRNLMSHWENPETAVLGSSELPTPFTTRESAGIGTLTEKMMLLDSLAYLPDDILVKVDRASMAVSLESRAPLLDYRLFEFAWRTPLEFKVRQNKGKWLLRELLYRYVPQALVDRPKAGFAIPVAQWLRGPLRSWAEDLLSEDRLRREGLLETNTIRQTWQEHLAGYNWSDRLWAVLMLESWLEESKKPATVLSAVK
jgi:asparagine synthase (glutamine-hydrolysing)